MLLTLRVRRWQSTPFYLGIIMMAEQAVGTTIAATKDRAKDITSRRKEDQMTSKRRRKTTNDSSLLSNLISTTLSD